MISQNGLKLLLKANIQTALDNYWAHTSMGVDDIYNNVSQKFINRLAEDAIYAKADLRDMLRKSSAWDEKLQAVIINGTKTHDTNYDKVRDLAYRIIDLYSLKMNNEIDIEVYQALRFFFEPTTKMKDDAKEIYIKAIEKFAPNAYHKGRKRSRIFMALCKALGIADMSSGSKFQQLYAQFADELSSKKIDFKLFLSINPAHFLTMSNPKRDIRGEMLTSCHSLNSTEYDYNNGCTGYARDDVTMIAFTVDDPSIAETLMKTFIYNFARVIILAVMRTGFILNLSQNFQLDKTILMIDNLLKLVRLGFVLVVVMLSTKNCFATIAMV